LLMVSPIMARYASQHACVLQQVLLMHWPLLQRPLPPQTQHGQSGSEHAVLLGLSLVVHPPKPLHVELFWHDPGVHV
jgi:hypothetical protein